MTEKPTYEDLEQRVKELESEAFKNTRKLEQLRMLSSVFEQIDSSIAVLDTEGKVEYANPKLLEAYKISPVEIIGKNWRSFLSQFSSLREEYPKILNTVIKKGETWNGEISDINKSGMKIWRQVTIFPIKSIGELSHIVYMSEDITARKIAEAALRESEERYRSLFENTGTATFVVEEDLIIAQVNSKCEELSGYSKDEIEGKLKSTVFIADEEYERIKKYHIGRREKDGEIPSEYEFKFVDKHGNIKNVFIQVGMIPRTKQSIASIIDITPRKEAENALRESEEKYRELANSLLPSMIEITQNITSDATIWGEPTQLHQIIMNLCTNAFHAMRESGGVLSVQMAEVVLNATELFHTNDLPPGRYIKLVVSDTGHGMDFNTLQRLFDPYFTTKEANAGTGLGLSVTHGIVKSHGGAINVESAPGDGSAFTVLIPVIDQDTKEDRIEEVPIPKGSARILFVDDEELFYDLVKRLLEDLGYEVTALQNSLEALKTFQTRPDYFDLVITDQTMPKLTGVQLASELIKIRPGIPIILCTGFSEQVSEKTAADFGISEFVMKPINIRKLAETIRKVLDGELSIDN